MALRVTQRNLYSSVINRMNSNLTAYMKTHEQSSSQKKVNKPSDDPYGASQIMHSYNQLGAIASHKDNLSMASSWLSQADNALSMVDTSLQSLIGLLEQGASGTYKDQMDELAVQVRTIFEQLLTYANVDFVGRYLFGGTRTDSAAYVLAHHAHSNDEDLTDVMYSVKGNPAYTTLIQFTTSGDLDDVPPPDFRYSQDGGKTWQTGSWNMGPPLTMQCGADVDIELYNYAGVPVDAVDPNNVNETDNGTWIYVRPTAEYKGDTNGASVVQSYPYTSPVGASASGVFTRDVAVRIDNVAAGVIYYSYSTDDGTSWTSGEAADIPPNSKLYVAGGYLNLASSPTVGHQFIIRPHRADINLNIGASGAMLTINNVGTEVFGGIYAEPFSSIGAQPVMRDDPSSNLFEVIGKAIGYLETGSQAGCQEALDAINNSVVAKINQARTSIGARVNRADEFKYHLEQKNIDVNSRLSDLEDADLSELMTRLAQQELAYRTVLQSSSMIMQISLLNYI